MGEDPALAGLPEPGESVFYPKVGHCTFRGVIEDRVAPGTRLLELEDVEEGSRILIPLDRVPELHLRAAGASLEEIQEELSAEFEEPIEDDDERHGRIEELVVEGSARNLAKALKRLHFLRQATGLSREEEQTRKKIRGWLAAEVAISRQCTRAEAQAFLTRALQDAMSEHKRREKEEAKERRRVAKEQKKAQAAAAEVESRPEAEAPAAEAEADESETDAEAENLGSEQTRTSDELTEAVEPDSEKSAESTY